MYFQSFYFFNYYMFEFTFVIDAEKPLCKTMYV